MNDVLAILGYATPLVSDSLWPLDSDYSSGDYGVSVITSADGTRKWWWRYTQVVVRVSGDIRKCTQVALSNTSLPHPDTGIWLRQEIILPNWVGRITHRR